MLIELLVQQMMVHHEFGVKFKFEIINVTNTTDYIANNYRDIHH